VDSPRNRKIFKIKKVVNESISTKEALSPKRFCRNKVEPQKKIPFLQTTLIEISYFNLDEEDVQIFRDLI